VNRKLFERRQKMVKYIAQGIQLRAVMKQLANDYNVEENTLWQDWYRRDKWLPLILQIDEANAKRWFGDLFAMIMEARNAFWSIYLKTDNPFAKIRAIEKAVSTAETQMKILNSILFSSSFNASHTSIKLVQVDAESIEYLNTLFDLEKELTPKTYAK
jgi:hypothetical protein